MSTENQSNEDEECNTTQSLFFKNTNAFDSELDFNKQ